MIEALTLVIFPLCMVFAALSDFLSMKISNWISVVLVVMFAVFAPLSGMEWTAFFNHFLVSIVLLVVGFVLFVAGLWGGGDAKFFASTSLWLGFNEILMDYVFISSLLGAFLAICIIIYQKTCLSDFFGNNRFLKNFNNNKKNIPYGVALGGGGLLVYPYSALGGWALARLLL